MIEGGSLPLSAKYNIIPIESTDYYSYLKYYCLVGNIIP